MNKLFFWVEEYLFYPKKISQKLLGFLLLPFTLIYCLIVTTKRIFTKKIDFNTPIIGIGNLTIGGSGKTPFTIALAKKRKNIAIILRGYNRNTKDLLIVSEFGNIKCGVKDCGDEAMLYAKNLSHALILVSIDRVKAIKYAKDKGMKIIFLDDAFHHNEIKKFDILLRPLQEYSNNFCLPSGPYRESKKLYKKADMVLKEGIDFKREVKLINKTNKMVLVTAISKPERLEKFLPDNSIIGKVYYKDHYYFNKNELLDIVRKYNATSILTTTKDAVKMENFGLKLSILDLKIIINADIVTNIDNFIDNFGKIK